MKTEKGKIFLFVVPEQELWHHKQKGERKVQCYQSWEKKTQRRPSGCAGRTT